MSCARANSFIVDLSLQSKACFVVKPGIPHSSLTRAAAITCASMDAGFWEIMKKFPRNRFFQSA
jgi:hypothetical protein